jgi:hypothetical protein
MGKPAWFDHNDAVAWLILGYLYSHPDAKDTVDGVEKWWLNDMEVSMDARTVQASLEHLVKLGWLVSREGRCTGVVYGLNEDRREKLRQFLQDTAELY